jgi:hypothetical protein
MDFGDREPRKRRLKQLRNGEIYVDNLTGTVDFQVWYQPDQYPAWILWFAWSETAGNSTPGSQPQFRPRMGLGEPDPQVCDPLTNRPFRNGYTFQIKIVIVGHCRFIGAMFECVTLPESVQMAPKCVSSSTPALILPTVQP